MNMSIRPMCAALALALLAAGCHRNDANNPDMNAPAPAATVAPPVETMPPEASTVAAPAPAGTTGMPMDAAQSADQGFVGEAMRSNEDEIAVSQLAMDKGGASVKSLATMLHKDHTAMRDKLNAVAHGTPAPTPGTAPADLQSLSGKAFDTRVLSLLRDAHEDAIAKFTAASNNSALSEDVRKLASDALPTLKDHLDKVKAAQAKE